MLADLVIEGGGVKVIGLAGALEVAEKKGFTWKRVAGTSAGSIVATLLAAGYEAKELHQILMDFDMSELVKPSKFHVPYLSHLFRLCFHKGLHSARRLEKWVDSLLAAKGVHTFADLSAEIELQIIASDISSGNLMVLPRDLERYGYRLDQFSVARAVRMSCSIPFFFQPSRMHDRKQHSYCYVVDGAVLSNFPVWLFDDKPERPTFGLRLYAHQKRPHHQIKGPISLFTSMFLTMMDAHDNLSIRNKDQLRTIFVPTLGVKLTDFSLSKEEKGKLYQAGVQAAEKFFENWSLESYLEARYDLDAYEKIS